MRRYTLHDAYYGTLRESDTLEGFSHYVVDNLRYRTVVPFPYVLESTLDAFSRGDLKTANRYLSEFAITVFEGKVDPVMAVLMEHRYVDIFGVCSCGAALDDGSDYTAYKHIAEAVRWVS